MVGNYFCYQFKLFQTIWQKDASYISYLTLFIFYISTIWLGKTTFNISNNLIDNFQAFEFKRKEEVGWFISELCLTLGLIGTIVGFVLMLVGFESINMADVKTIQSLLGQLGKSMATAIYTTLVGLICGLLIKIQCFNISLELRKYE